MPVAPARTAQAVTGLILAGFSLPHLLNTMCAVRPGAYDAVQAVLQRVYQHPLVEPIVLGAVVIHAGLGIAEMRKGRTRTADLPLRQRLHRWASWYLLLVIVGHVGATRIMPAIENATPHFAGLTFSVAWIPWFFLPYYAGLALAGLYHTVNGIGIAGARLGAPVLVKITGGRPAQAGMAIAAVLLLAGIAGIAGWLYAIHDPFDNPYAAVYRRVFGDLVPAAG